MNDQAHSEHHRIDLRTREGKAMAAQVSAINEGNIRASLADMSATADSGPSQDASAGLEIIAPSGKRITRENRRGFGNQGQKLSYPEREGYHRHWFNDTPGRIQGAQESGYTPVKDPGSGQNVSRVVGTAPNNDPLSAFLHEIPQEWYDDDMRELEKINAEKEASIKSGAQAKDGKDTGQFYAGAQGRAPSIRQGLSRR